MNVHSYWHDLQRAHALSLSRTPGPGAADLNLSLMVAGVCALTALILFVSGGYRVGFEAMRGIGLYLPPVLLDLLSEFGETSAAICLIALIARRHPRVLWMGTLASVYATLLTHALKGLCDTSRPAAVLGDWVAVSGPVLKLHSFPSGHTMTAFLLAACFSAAAPRNARLLPYALATLVGLSRVWIGAHWPIDVLVGAGIAGLCTALAIRTVSFLNFGLRLAPHLFLVSLIAACAVFELVRVAEHPPWHLLGAAIAATSLSVVGRDYVVEPLFRSRLETFPPYRGT